MKLLLVFQIISIANVLLTTTSYFVVPFGQYTLFKPISGGGNFVFKCQCFKLGSFEVCENCINIRYILNYVADNICVKQVPKAVKEKMVKIEDYIKNIKNEPFFYFWKLSTKIHLSLDNPNLRKLGKLKIFGN